jgi:hypothetical protein
MSILRVSPQKRQVADHRTSVSTRARFLPAVAAAATAIAGILLFAATTHPVRMDYSEYWASAQLLVHHNNPYSPASVFAVEKAAGRPATTPLIMLNPPWTLFLVAPLGFCGLHFGLFLWTLASTACVLVSSRLLEMPPNDRPLAFLFAPVIACILSGQSAPFLLLGFTLFLRYHSNRPFLAGASLLLMAIKPHLFLVFWLLLFVDCVYRRRLLMLAGGLSALAAATAFSMFFDPRIFQHYFTTMREFNRQGFLPTASMLFRILIDPHAVWLLLVPSIAAAIWALWYYLRWRQSWNWKSHGMLLILVTILVSPYGFFTDEIVLLPSVVFALSFPRRRRNSVWILLLINGAALVIIFATQSSLASSAFLWTPLAWLGWFLYATAKPSAPGTHAPSQLETSCTHKEVSALRT